MPYAAMNPGKYHLGNAFNFPPLQNRKYIDKNIIKKIMWKTAVLLNRRIYVGNVKITDKDGKVEVLNDSIFKSRTNKFDSFTLDRRIDVAVGDGEQIIHLATYADRLLQFKEDTLHIINVAGQSEYLESTHKYKGISNKNHVCNTDYGIAWCNAYGVYLYDGRQVVDLIDSKGIKRIKPSTWDTFFSDDTMIGYIPLEKQLLLLKSSSTNGDILTYDTVTKAWTKGTDRAQAKIKTNMINIWDGNLVYGYEGPANTKTTIGKWSASPTAVISNFKVYTKELDFGTMAKKKVTKVYITYKGGAPGEGGGADQDTDVKPLFARDGGGFTGTFEDSGGAEITELEYKADWFTKELYPKSDASDLRSFAFGLESVDNSSNKARNNFEVNDITIVFRTKDVK